LYTLFGVLADAEELAMRVAAADRARYTKFLAAAEEFAIENGLIVGRESATATLLGTPPAGGHEAERLDFYSDKAFADAKRLGDAMYALDPDGLGHYTAVVPRVPDYMFAISVDGRELFTVTKLPVYRGVRIGDVVMPSRRAPRFAAPAVARLAGPPPALLCMGPELQLMEVYAALCDPAKADSWDNALGRERALRIAFNDEITMKLKTSAAAAAVGGEAARGDAGRRVVAALCADYIAGPGRVLIGPAAIAMMVRPAAAWEPRGRLQVATEADPEADAREVSALIRRRVPGVDVQWGVNDPKVPTDMRVRRTTVYITCGGGDCLVCSGPSCSRERLPVLDIYNVASHELVPYVAAAELGGARRAAVGGRAARRDHGRRGRGRARGDERKAAPERGQARKDARDSVDVKSTPVPRDLRIGTPFVLMRFRLVDMWTMQVLMHMKVVSVAYAMSQLREMQASFTQAADYYEQILATADVDLMTARLLPLKTYVGRAEDLGVAIKRAAAARREDAPFVPPYYPAARAAKHVG
jgi:hypothetical protein